MYVANPKNTCQAMQTNTSLQQNEHQEYNIGIKLLNEHIERLENHIARLDSQTLKLWDSYQLQQNNISQLVEEGKRRQKDELVDVQNELKEYISRQNSHIEKLEAQNQKLTRSYENQQRILSQVLGPWQSCKYDNPIGVDVISKKKNSRTSKNEKFKGFENLSFEYSNQCEDSNPLEESAIKETSIEVDQCRQSTSSGEEN